MVKSAIERTLGVITRGSAEKKRRLEKRDEKQKGKRPIKYVYIELDSDFETDDHYRKRRTKYVTSESEDTDDERYIRSRKSAQKDTVVIKPKNSFGGVSVNLRQTYYRSNMRAAIKEIKRLEFTEQQLLEIKKTPFWLLFNSIFTDVNDSLRKKCTKFEKDIIEIVRRFDVETESFVIGGQRVALSKHDAELIFGISNGTEEISQRLEEYQLPNWVNRCFMADFQARPALYQSLYKPQIMAKIKEVLKLTTDESSKDVARLMCCYLMATVLCPVRSGAVPWHLTVYFEDFSNICKYDWSTFIVDQLKGQLRRSKLMKSGGCAMMLPFWLCEHSKLVEPINATAFPRFLKWDTKTLNHSILRGKLHRPTKVFTEELKATADEKEQLMSLRRFRALEQPQVSKKLDSSGINAKESDGKQNVVFQQSSSKRFEVGSSWSGKESFAIECPSFDIGLGTVLDSGRNVQKEDDSVLRVCGDYALLKCEMELEATITELTRKNKELSSQMVCLKDETKEELTLACNKVKELEAIISRLTHKNRVFSDQCASYESQVDALEIENKKTKEELMNAEKKYYSGARAAGYAEGLQKGKAKWLKSIEFLHHLTDASMQYFDYGFDSCEKQAKQQGFVGQLDKDSALKEAPKLKGWESSDRSYISK